MSIQTGLTATVRFTVTEDDTAAALGSGSLPVLGTPRMLAWCEAATCAAIASELPVGHTSVGTRVDLEHLAASPVGADVEITATVAYVDPSAGPGRAARLMRLAVVANAAGGGKLLASGEITRVVVDAERFLARTGG